MKTILGTIFAVAGLAAASHADEELALDPVLFADGLWEKSLEEIKGAFEPEAEEGEEGDNEQSAARSALEKQILERLRKQGLNVDDLEDPGAFQWLSAEKQALRAPRQVVTLLGKDVGEVVIRARDGAASDVSISLFNRGDDGEITKSEFEARMSGWHQALNEKLAVRPEERNKQGAVATTGWMWKKDEAAFLLEGSVTRRENRAEFIRLRMAPLHRADTRRKIVRRGSLDDNVVRKDGDVMVKGIPMVDQGDKGYCVVATVERVARYYGLQVDQHELAQLANTDQYGTSGNDMEKAFRTLTGKIHARTLKHIEYDDRQFERDYKSYNRAAKKEGVRVFEEDLDEWIIDPRWFWFNAHKATFRTVKASQNKYDHFRRKIEEYVDQGIPLCWTLYMGMFKEDDTPQSYGGHMRLIIGYNNEKEEIIYSDSWGKGHAVKRMRADEAWCMTMALYSMLPNR
ncbi:MAG: hypothetical protein HKN82_07390 [Akkermansiaceae bacterium]|nr:hypothetical protein [Akkermansiaceae bacterium]NNM30732.1 hypothetical protein [Akkermansiaceae bacterium]